MWEAGFDVTSGASPFPIRLSRPPVWLLDEELCFRPAGLIKAPRAITASSCHEIDPVPHRSSAEIPQFSPHHLTLLCFTNSQKKRKRPKTTQLYNPPSHAIHRSLPVTPPPSRWPSALSLKRTVDLWKSGHVCYQWFLVILSHTGCMYVLCKGVSGKVLRTFYRLSFFDFLFKDKFYVLNI